MQKCRIYLMIFGSILMFQLSAQQAEDYYKSACAKVKSKEYKSACEELEQAFKAGLKHPMRVASDPCFNALIADPEPRKVVRDLIKTYSNDASTSMVQADEPGERIEVVVTIIDEESGRPLPDVSVELVHTDSAGMYFAEQSTWNPRLFAYLKTDASGQVKVNTIRPGGYADDEGAMVPAHIHFNLEKDGYRLYASEFSFEDEPLILQNGNLENLPIAQRVKGQTVPRYIVTIGLQPD